MNKLVMSFVCTFLLTACGGGSSSSSDSNSTTTTNSILGEWHYVHDSSQCLEVNTYQENGTFDGVSLDEIYSGDYTFESTVTEGRRHKLTLTITSDNERTDCYGSMSNDVGLTRTVYASFQSENIVVFYAERSGGNPFFEFEKQN